MKSSIHATRPPGDRPLMHSGVVRARPAAEDEPARRPRRGYVTYALDTTAESLPSLRRPEREEAVGRRPRREPWYVGVLAWLRQHGFSDMWNPWTRFGDRTLALLIAALTILGLLMVYSAAIGVHQLLDGGVPGKWVVRQGRWAIAGVAVFVLAWRIRYTFWRRWSVLLMGLTLFALGATKVLGYDSFGSARSLLANGSIQPAEAAKLVIIMYLADWLASKGAKIRDLSFGLIPFTIMLGTFVALVASQKASTAVLLAFTAVAMFFIAGTDLRQIGVVVALVGGAFAIVFSLVSYIHDRFEQYWEALRDPAEAGVMQVQQFMQSLREGGFTGKGLGRGTIKDLLFASHSDGIFAVIGEELGLLGCLVVIVLFIGVAYRGLRCVWNVRDSDGYGQLLAFGITVWLITQALVHIGVVTVTVPATGIPLPFISYGGTALLTCMAGAGVLMSISCSIPEDAR